MNAASSDAPIATGVPIPPAQSHAIAELIRLYDRIAADSDRSIAPLGFSMEKIHAKMVIDPDGSNAKLEDIRIQPLKGKPIHQSMLLPDSGGRSGTSIRPNFLWDNTGYVLGRDNKGNPERAEECFDAFCERHRSFSDRLADDAGFQSVLRFFSSWNPADSEQLANWNDLQGLNVVFQIRGQKGYVHESAAVQAGWDEHIKTQAIAEQEFLEGPSLFDGQSKRLARLHPQVQGVTGANTSGAALVSFNKSAFESYGKSKSYNSPLGEEEAFKYTTALQMLLSDRGRRFALGDSTVVFWTDAPGAEGTSDAEHAIQLFSEPIAPKKDRAEHDQLILRLRGFLTDAQNGIVSDHVHDPEAIFFLLGLSPSTSRLSIRYWMTGTLQDLAERLQRHLDDLEITGLDTHRLPFARSVAYETARDPKEISPVLAGEILRSILNETAYPASLLPAIVRRCRVEQNVRPMQAAIMKACINRQQRMRLDGAVVPTQLQESFPSTAYQIGRVVGVLDAAHLAASGGRIKESAARSRLSGICCNPIANLPPLLSLHTHHMAKIPSEPQDAKRLKVRVRGTYARDLQSALSRIVALPTTLTVDDQAVLLIGFYHQTQHTFRSSLPKPKENT